MGRKDDPEGSDFAEKREKTFCQEHGCVTKLCKIVYGDDDKIESHPTSIVAILHRNGLILRIMMGLVITLATLIAIPSVTWIFAGGKVLKQIEVNTLLLQKHDKEIDDLQTFVYEMKEPHKGVMNVGTVR